MAQKQNYGLSVATSLVIASMVGTGVFTSLGFQVVDIKSGFSIIVLWLLGGLIALLGAFSYAEISTTLKRSGGEYNYLTKLYSPALGFMAGIVSLIVGFAAPIAAVSMAIGEYLEPLIHQSFSDNELFSGVLTPKTISLIAIFTVSGIHILGVKTGGFVQNLLTLFKIGFILFLIAIPFLIPEIKLSTINFSPQKVDWALIFSTPFFISLVYVYYSYSGWNASVYVADNLKDPRKVLPYSLLIGTAFVTILYVSLNMIFLYVCDFKDLEGKLDIGNVFIGKIFSPDFTPIFSGIFSLALLASLSALIIAGPRVGETMGEDYPKLRKLAIKNKYESPWVAIVVQGAISIFLLYTGTFEEILKFIGVSLSLFALLTVAGVFILRAKNKSSELGVKAFKTPFYPIGPAIFIITNSLMIGYVLTGNFKITIASAFTFLISYLIYLLLKPTKP